MEKKKTRIKNIVLTLSILINLIQFMCLLYLLNKHVYQFGVRYFFNQITMSKQERTELLEWHKKWSVRNPRLAENQERWRQEGLTQADIVMMGDSISGSSVDWAQLLGYHPVANRVVGSDSLYGFVHRSPDIIALQPKVCFVMGGINSIPVIPIEDVYSEYVSLLEILQSHGIIPVVQSTLYTSPRSEGYLFKNRLIKKLNRLLQQYAQKKNIDFVDLNSVLSNGRHLLDDYADSDGVHLSEAAYPVWAETIKPYLKKYGLSSGE